MSRSWETRVILMTVLWFGPQNHSACFAEFGPQNSVATHGIIVKVRQDEATSYGACGRRIENIGVGQFHPRWSG
jgi:hypothetical protein